MKTSCTFSLITLIGCVLLLNTNGIGPSNATSTTCSTCSNINAGEWGSWNNGNNWWGHWGHWDNWDNWEYWKYWGCYYPSTWGSWHNSPYGHTWSEFWARWVDWAPWEEWNGCSRTCGGGHKTRIRYRCCARGASEKCTETSKCPEVCLNSGTFDTRCRCTDQFFGECCENCKYNNTIIYKLY